MTSPCKKMDSVCKHKVYCIAATQALVTFCAMRQQHSRCSPGEGQLSREQFEATGSHHAMCFNKGIDVAGHDGMPAQSENNGDMRERLLMRQANGQS